MDTYGPHQLLQLRTWRAMNGARGGAQQGNGVFCRCACKMAASGAEGGLAAEAGARSAARSAPRRGPIRVCPVPPAAPCPLRPLPELAHPTALSTERPGPSLSADRAARRRAGGHQTRALGAYGSTASRGRPLPLRTRCPPRKSAPSAPCAKAPLRNRRGKSRGLPLGVLVIRSDHVTSEPLGRLPELDLFGGGPALEGRHEVLPRLRGERRHVP